MAVTIDAASDTTAPDTTTADSSQPPQADPTQSPQLRYFKVVRASRVGAHDAPSLAAPASEFIPPHAVVRGALHANGWVRLAEPGDDETDDGDDGAPIGYAATAGGRWVLLHHPTEGAHLEAVRSARFRVAHKAVLVRRAPDTASSVLQIRREGDVLSIHGHLNGWLKVSMPTADARTDEPAWALLRHPTYGLLLSHEEGEIPTFDSPRALRGSFETTPGHVYSGERPERQVIGDMRRELERMRQAVAERERLGSVGGAGGGAGGGSVGSLAINAGLMANAGTCGANGFCCGGDPI